MKKARIMIFSTLTVLLIFSYNIFAAWQGDIPDNQVFIKYTSKRHQYSLKIPQGWSITKYRSTTKITYNYDGVSVRIKKESDHLNFNNIKHIAIKSVKGSYNKASIKIVEKVTMKSLFAVKVTYKSNSKPSSVTGKSLRLENESYFFHKKGKLLELRFWAPVGTDNADQWKMILHSFVWK